MWKMNYIKVILIVILVRGDGGLHKDRMERAGFAGYSGGRQCLLAYTELKCLLVGTSHSLETLSFPLSLPIFPETGSCYLVQAGLKLAM